MNFFSFFEDRSSHHNDKSSHDHDRWNDFSYNPGVVEQTIDVPHYFVGNAFPTNLVEGQALSTANQADLGEVHCNMVVTNNTLVTGDITYDGGDNYNSLGAFSITASGTIQAVQMLDSNVNSGPDTPTNVPYSYQTGTGATEIGFFVVSDGGVTNSGLNLSNGTLALVYDYGQQDQRLANTHDSGSNISLVFTDANNVAHVLNGPLFYTTDRGGSDSLNSDGLVHTVSGIDGNDPSTLKISFEDLPLSSTDKDYNDLEFTMQTTNEYTIVSCGGGHSCWDFNQGCHDQKISSYCNGDKLDISSLIDCGSNAVQGAINKYVEFTSNGNGTCNLEISSTGKAADFHTVATLNTDLSKVAITTLIADGTLVTHHS